MASPTRSAAARTVGPPNLASAIDAPIEHTLLASKFIYTGTLDKYPNLQIVLPHAGGAFPYLAGRVEHFLYHMNDHSTSIQHPFRDYLRRFHYDYLIYYPEAFRFLLGLVGSDRIVVGTDNFAAKDIDYPARGAGSVQSAGCRPRPHPEGKRDEASASITGKRGHGGFTRLQ